MLAPPAYTECVRTKDLLPRGLGFHTMPIVTTYCQDLDKPVPTLCDSCAAQHRLGVERDLAVIKNDGTDPLSSLPGVSQTVLFACPPKRVLHVGHFHCHRSRPPCSLDKHLSSSAQRWPSLSMLHHWECFFILCHAPLGHDIRRFTSGCASRRRRWRH